MSEQRFRVAVIHAAYMHESAIELVMSGQARRVASGLYERDEPARVAAEDDWHDHITGATE